QSKQNQINTLNSQLNKANYDIKELHAQKNVLSQKINCLNQDINQKQAEINQLTRQLIQYSNMRIAEGKYIGNIKEKNSRYHFNPKCPDWKMLVAEYVLRLDDSPNRNIVSSNNSRIFIKHHLKKCKNCSQLN
ncbi:coiled-coil domain-containing protein, partial [Planktothrix sp.]|uniref:coiled-coil domain-containing protein n=5 Tax=Planktothrix sp. TaxID=3088171 RepID=UPI0038D37D3C